MEPKKETWIAVVLTLFFSTLGLFYVLPPVKAILVNVGAFFALLLTAGLAGFVIWPGAVIYAAVAVPKLNAERALPQPAPPLPPARPDVSG